MPSPVRVLFVEVAPGDAESVLVELRGAGFAPENPRLVSISEPQAILESGQGEILFLESSLAHIRFLAGLALSRDGGPRVPWIVLSDTAEEDAVVEAMRAGASDFVSRQNLSRLGPAVTRALRLAAERNPGQAANAENLPPEAEKSRLVAALRERLKELTALHQIARLLQDSKREPTGLLKSVVDLLPPAWLHADQAAARISLPGLEVATTNYRPSPWRLAAKFVTEGGPGQVEVVYLAEQPAESEGPFLAEERQLLDSVAEMIQGHVHRRQAETALRESEERYRQLADAMPQIVWVTKPDGYHEYFNRQWYEYTGLTYEQTRGDGWSHVYHPAEQAQAWQNWRHALDTGEPFEVEYRCRRRDGAYRWFLGRALPQRDDQGSIVRWIGTCTDIHDLKQIQAERDQAIFRLDLQIDRLPLAYLLTDADNRFLRWNPAAEKLFGFPAAEVLGKHPFEVIVPPVSRDLVENIFARLRAGDQNAHGTCANTTRAGKTIVCEWHNTPLFGPDGTFEGILSLAQDVTERQSLELQFRQAQKMEAIGRLAGGVAHDFNNLLTVITGYVDILLLRMPLEEAARELVREIRKAGERAAGLTRQLLAFSRKSVLEPRILDINSQVRDMSKLLQRLIGEDIELSTALDPALGLVKADPNQLEHAVVNLCVNARDAMPQGGRITLETSNVVLDEGYAQKHPGVQPGRYVLLAMTDTGHGMDADTRTQIFEPFFTTKESGQGTGLGLAMVYGFIKQSGGHIAVYSEPGQGATFKLYLPRTEGPSVARKSEPGLNRMPRGTETLLLVEDEAGVRGLARLVLETCGYHVLEARDGREGIEAARDFAKPIHLIVTDVVMPHVGGRQMAQTVLTLHPEARVLYLSGYTDDAVVRHGVLEANVHFLQKPFTPYALAQKVREVLDAE